MRKGKLKLFSSLPLLKTVWVQFWNKRKGKKKMEKNCRIILAATLKSSRRKRKARKGNVIKKLIPSFLSRRYWRMKAFGISESQKKHRFVNKAGFLNKKSKHWFMCCWEKKNFAIFFNTFVYFWLGKFKKRFEFSLIETRT